MFKGKVLDHFGRSVNWMMRICLHVSLSQFFYVPGSNNISGKSSVCSAVAFLVVFKSHELKSFIDM